MAKFRKSFNDLEVFFAEWCFIAILFGYQVSATLSILLGVSSTPISVTYRAGYLLMALTIIFIEFITQFYKKRAYSVYIVPLTLFWIAYVIRMYYDFYIVEYASGYASNGFLFYFQYGF